MNTTAIFIEILIIGIQASLWMALLIFSFVDYRPILSIQASFNNWTNPIIFIIFSFCYTLGIMVDRVSDILFMSVKPENFVDRIPFIKEKFEKYYKDSDYRILVLLKENKVNDFLEYVRRRERIIRATLFNFTMIIITITPFIFKNYSFLKSAFILVVIITIDFIIYIVLGTLEKTYSIRLEQAKKAIDELQKQK